MDTHPYPTPDIEEKLDLHPVVELRLCLLGGFHMQHGEKAFSAEAIRLQKGRNLLKLLALAPDHRLHREQLMDLLWPEHSPRDAAHNLGQTLYKLRPTLLALDPSSRLAYEAECLALTAEGGISTDVEDFEQAARAALNHLGPMNSHTAALCQGAIASYPGDLLPEDGPADLFYQRRDQLRQLYLSLLLQLADYYLQTQEYLPAITALQKVLTADAAHEGAHIRLMRAYALSGNRQAALRQYQILEEALRQELDVEPSAESQCLQAQIVGEELGPAAPPDPVPARPRPHLPTALSSFVGRESEIVQLQELIHTHRLVTLTGVGGVGKTRLALIAAEAMLSKFTHGVYWVDLASRTSPTQVTKAILDVLQLPDRPGLEDMARLAGFLQEQHLLLILDNCEHLLEACSSLIQALSQACPRLHFLATSRVRINLPGEYVYQVSPLAVPDTQHPISLPELGEYEAVRLFTARASSASRGFAPTNANAQALAQICQCLDGIPLALELAAARCRMLTVEQIAFHLKDALRLLGNASQATPPHQRTLRASLDWSYALLSTKEQILLQRLSVFAGGWDMGSAEAVCAGGVIQAVEVLDLIASLVDHSLVAVDTVNMSQARYHLLEIVRQYAYEHLVQSGEAPEACRRHLTYYLEMAEQADQQLRGPGQLLWIRRLETESSNLTAALERAFDTPAWATTGMQLACALQWYWGLIGSFSQEKNFIGKALSLSADLGRTPLRAKVLFCAGSLSGWGGILLSTADALACLEESLALWQELGQVYLQEQAQCLLALGSIQELDLREEQGMQRMVESLAIFQQNGNIWWQAWALNLIGGARQPELEDPLAVRAALEELIGLWKKAGDQWGEAITLLDWGQFLLNLGRFTDARGVLMQCLESYQVFGAKGMMFQALRDLGHTARALQEYDLAEQYYEHCLALMPEIGWKSPAPYLGLSWIALRRENARQAQALLNTSLATAQETELEDRVILTLAGFASLHTIQNNWVTAARLWGAYFAQVKARQIQISSVFQLEIEYFRDSCRANNEEASWEAALNAGSQMTLEEALALAQEAPS